jgi:hypothetical protein
MVVALPGQQQNETRKPRFDELVREDMFSGLAGDDAAFNRAMKLCETRLAANPNDPEAMVWHGAGTYFRAGLAFSSGDRETGLKLRKEGTQEMDSAVKLSPTIRTLIPRGALLLAAGRRIKDPTVRERTLKQGISDFERVLELDKQAFPGRCEHAKGELLGGLAEGWYRLGKEQEASVYLKRIMAELPGTAYSKAAESLVKNKSPADQASVTCLGCHVTPSLSAAPQWGR